VRKTCFWVLFLIGLTGCNALAPAAAIPLPLPSRTPSLSTSSSPTRTPFLPIPPTPTITLTPTPVPALWVAPYLPEAVRQAIALPSGLAKAGSPDEAILRLEVGDQQPLSHWVYALVAPFPTIPDDVSADELRRAWQGEAVGPFAGHPLLMDESTFGVFSALWGEPSAEAIKILPTVELLDYAWNNRPAWAIVPFETVEPRWKVLQVDGHSPLWKGFDPADYPLTVTFSLIGDLSLLPALQSSILSVPSTNRDSAKLTTVMMTGVTALVRATAYTMNQRGILYPGQDIRDTLREADILHISNEVPYAPDCPLPNPNQADLRFCSDPAYNALLEDVGADVIELTGDHFGDYGAGAMRDTLDLYREKGWVYYGGGYDRDDARQARLIEHHGNKIAFIGCNAKGDGYATASDATPGAVACDFDWMHGEIARLRAEGYLVIATFQHFEYYTYAAQPNQIADSRGMAEAGAVIVSGSQAHQPQAMEFYKGAFIHYGLGNLFFDQYYLGLPTSQGFLDRHVFYDGRYLGVEPLGILFIDFARPRPMTRQERTVLLRSVFEASGW
jgi:poly-gamma-glutamate synthesis protein (capsule biosynthesis protein)